MGLQEYGIKRTGISIENLVKEIKKIDSDYKVNRCMSKSDFAVKASEINEEFTCKAGEEVDFVYGDRHNIRDVLNELSNEGFLQYICSELINKTIHGTMFPSAYEVSTEWEEYKEGISGNINSEIPGND